MNKNALLVSLIFCFAPCSILQSSNISKVQPLSTSSRATKNSLAPTSQDPLDPFFSIIDASTDKARFMYSQAKHIAEDNLGAYNRYTLDEQFKIALCSGRYDILESLPNKKSWLSNIFKNKNTQYVNDHINKIMNDYTQDTPLHVVVRIAAYHNNSIKYASTDTERYIAQDKRKDLFKVIQFLLKNNAGIDSKNIQGKTPLHIACKDNDPEMHQLLLKAGANPMITDKQGKTPINYADTSEKSFAIFERGSNNAIKKIKNLKERQDQQDIDDLIDQSTKNKSPKNQTMSTIKENNPYEKIIYTGNNAHINDSIITDSITSDISSHRFVPKHTKFDSFGSTGDEHPGQLKIKPITKTRRPKTATTRQDRVIPTPETLIIDSNQRIDSYTTTQTTTRPLTANNQNKKAAPTTIPQEYLKNKKSVKGYSSTTSSHTESLSKSHSEVHFI
ncbi:MAG: ankyrin repeat domain-containing protein [Candidatus Chromulinivorax sp.]|nr:ankyrin repeat domain-containing protein [Candidatus Chromulinivorax sp.]